MSLAGNVVTVRGPISPQEVGTTLMHEHILACTPDIAGSAPAEPSRRQQFEAPIGIGMLGGLRYGSIVNRVNSSLDDIDTAIEELAIFRHLGGRTVVEATSIGIGRDPTGLVRVAQATGLNIVMGSSYYVESAWPPDSAVAAKSEMEICKQIVRDIEDGVDGTGVRAGLIGEVGCSWPLTVNERKVLVASATAQRATGAPLMIHPGPDPEAPLEIIEILRQAGADLSRTIMCHIERTIDEKPMLKQLAETGCLLEYDLFGFENSYYAWDMPVDLPNDAGRIRWLQWLIAEGHGDQILVSHDIFFKHQLVRYGGHGYGHILANAVPLMRRKGLSAEQIEQILVETPRKVLTFAESR